MAQAVRVVKDAFTMLFLFELFFLTLGVLLASWVLVDWLLERRMIRERRSRARLRHILHRRSPGQPCRRHTHRCIRRRQQLP